MDGRRSVPIVGRVGSERGAHGATLPAGPAAGRGTAVLDYYRRRLVKVLFIIHGSVFGGPHNQALRLAGPLAARGIETTVVLPREPGNAARRLRSSGIDVVEIPLHRVRASADPRVQLPAAVAFLPEVMAIRRMIRQRGVDVVQVGGLVNPHGAIAARLERVPVVWQLLDTRAPRPVAFAAMLFVRALATVVMPTGLKVLEHFPGSRHVRRRVVPFIPPVDTSVFRPRPELRSSVRMEWGVDGAGPVIGTVGNINPQKGYETLLEAFGRLRRDLPDARLVIVGSDHESHRGYAERVRSLVSSMGPAGDGVTFLGARPDVERQMQGFDVLALASVPRSEGIPTVLLEAMATGVPVVATDVGGVSEVVEDGVTGRVAPPLDPDGFAAAVLSVVRDADTRSAMGDAGRRRAEKRFSVEHCAETHVRAYERALATG